MPDVIVDSNVLTSGSRRGLYSPPALVVRSLIARRFTAILSQALLAEYRRVLHRPRLQRVHGMTTIEIDPFIKLIEACGHVVAPRPADAACPDPTDQHLWDLLAAVPGAILVTGDRKLLESTDFPGRILSPREFVERYGLTA